MTAFSMDQIRREAFAEMAAAVRAINIEKGWRPASGGPGDNSFGDYGFLLSEELGEMCSAYRKWRLADATEQNASCYVIDGTGMCATHHQHADHCEAPPKPEGVGSEMADLLIRLIDMADMFGIDLEAEYRRKVAYNRTRPVRHGGTMADPKPAAGNPRIATGGGKAARFHALWAALPDDSRGWWTGDEADAFVDAWQGLEMPHASMIDVTGDRVTLWCVDVRRAAEMVDTDAMNGDEFEICKGEYSVSVVQAEKKS